MDYNARSECFSSYPPILHSHHYRPDEVLQISSGNEQNYERGRLSAGPKIEVDDDTWGAKCNASSKAASHSAQAAIKRQIKKERRNKRTADDVKFESKWRGLRQEELESKRYLHYRENQRKRAKDRSNEEDVWPDNYEYAFQLGMSASSVVAVSCALADNLASIADRPTTWPEEGDGCVSGGIRRAGIKSRP